MFWKLSRIARRWSSAVLSHWNNFNLRKKLLTENLEFGKYGMFTIDYNKYHVIIAT